MSFTEICIYQVKPQKTDEFEALMFEAKSVKYMLYWEFDTKESYGAAQKNLYNSYWKAIEKCLIVPHDKYLGEPLF